MSEPEVSSHCNQVELLTLKSLSAFHWGGRDVADCSIVSFRTSTWVKCEFLDCGKWRELSWFCCDVSFVTWNLKEKNIPDLPMWLGNITSVLTDWICFVLFYNLAKVILGRVQTCDCNYGDFIVLPYWVTEPPAPRSNVPLSNVMLILSKPAPVLA